MTRLRFNLKDLNLPNQEEVKQIKGVLGVVVSGGQFQVVVGQNVPKVYDAVCNITGLAAQTAIEENLDGPKEKLTAKKIGSNILNYLSGSLTPLIPIIMGAAMFKTLLALFGSSMLGIIPDDSNLAILFDFVYDAGFYFFPIYVGYTAAKKLNTSIPLGMFLGGILLAPDFMSLIGSETAFSVYGIPCAVNDYSTSIVPILFTVWVMSYDAPLSGKIVPLNEIPDPVFSQGVLGVGCGIDPVSQRVVAPFDGKVTLVADTRHSVGLIGTDGTELLIHVGMDTVDMNGKGFSVYVKSGQSVRKGEPLLDFSLEAIRSAGHSAVTAVILCGNEEERSLQLADTKEIQSGEILMRL